MIVKKYFMILAAAAALVACSKNELLPTTNDSETEISYLVAPKTKTLSVTQKAFDTKWSFQSTAFYLKKTNGTLTPWAENQGSSSVYFENVPISYQTPVWRNADRKYYWPKDGSLTFFAWTVLSSAVDAAPVSGDKVAPTETQTTSTISEGVVTVTNTDGIKIAGYDVVDNLNKDILVADTKADMTANDKTPVYIIDGVPTLFRHKLSQVFFTAQTIKDEDAYDYTAATDKIKFEINSIKFIGIDRKNTFTQTNVAGAAGSWADAGAIEESQTYTSTVTEVKKDAATLIADGNQYYYLPQKFASQTAGGESKDYIEIKYTITYNVGEATQQVENFTKKLILNNSTSSSSIFAEWEMGKRYTINLRFSLDEILWDPAVENWDDKTNNVTIG